MVGLGFDLAGCHRSAGGALPQGDVTPPIITSSSAVSVPENATLLHQLTANEVVTWSLVGGADLGRIELSGPTLRWLADGTKNFESPNDADLNNAYVVTVRATDLASNTMDQTITVTVTDVAEGGGTPLNARLVSAGNFRIVSPGNYRKAA